MTATDASDLQKLNEELIEKRISLHLAQVAAKNAQDAFNSKLTQIMGAAVGGSAAPPAVPSAGPVPIGSAPSWLKPAQG